MHLWNKPLFKYMLFVLLCIGFILVAEPVSAAPTFSPQLATGENAPNAQTTIIMDHFLYLPLIVNDWPPLPNTPILSVSSSELYTITLTWYETITNTPVLHYDIQESTNVDFSDPVQYTTTEKTLSFPDKSFNTYYYRVRGYNAWGYGQWSNVESISLHTFLDSFNDPSTGWRARRTSSPDMSLMIASYVDGSLETLVSDKFDFAIFSPLRPAPELPYTIKLRTKVRHRVNEVSYGIAFGSNVGTYCEVNRSNSMGQDGCFAHYYRVNVIWAGNYLKFNVNRVDGHDDRGRGIATELMGFYNLTGLGYDPGDWHVWEIKVSETGFSIYVNGHYITHISDTVYINEPYHGIFSSTFEYNNAHFEHAYYYIYPSDYEDLINMEAQIKNVPQ